MKDSDLRKITTIILTLAASIIVGVKTGDTWWAVAVFAALTPMSGSLIASSEIKEHLDKKLRGRK